jgi:hypothetical protein
MSFSVEKVEISENSRLFVTKRSNTYIANLSGERYAWKYEAKSLQSVTKWVNKVKIEPLPYKYYQSGIDHLPHNDGFGNTTGMRKEYFEL